MSLRLRLLLSLSALVGVYAIAQAAIQGWVIAPRFQELEDEQARQDLERVLEALRNEVAHLDGLCHDWAAWDDTFGYVEAPNEAYEQANLQDTTLENNRLSILYAADRDGAVRIRRLRAVEAELSAFPEGTRPTEDPLHVLGDDGASCSGILMTEAGPMIVAARPILRSDESGPAAGALLMGRLLDEERLAELVRQTRVRSTLVALTEGAELEPGDAAAAAVLADGADAVVSVRDTEWITAHGIVPDVRGGPALLVRAEVPREVTAKGQDTIHFATGATVGAGLLILLGLLLLLQRTVIGPLTDLTAQAVTIGREGDLGRRIASPRRDEIGMLAGELDRMVAQLASSREELVQTARSAGMTEVATGVLHDVGNALASVTVSAAEIRRRAQELPIDDVARLAQEVRAQGDGLARFLSEDPRGRRYPEFLCLIAEHLGRGREALLREAIDLADGIGHVDALVKSQQDLATHAEVAQAVAPGAELDAALRIARVGPGDGIEIVREFEEVPRGFLPRHRLLQILVNLLKNARESLIEAAPDPKRIVLRLRRIGSDRIRFEVEDNGVGIDAGQRARLFQHGFTTKPGGHGFGLHAAANSAHALGGELTVESQGRGRGATFALELPYPVPDETGAGREAA